MIFELNKYNKEQLKVIKESMNQGLDIKPLLNPKYSALKMEFIINAIKYDYPYDIINIDFSYLDSFSKIDRFLRKIYIMGFIQSGYDVSMIANPNYKVSQLVQIHQGLKSGIDINQYLDWNIPAKVMREIRNNLEKDKEINNYNESFEKYVNSFEKKKEKLK